MRVHKGWGWQIPKLTKMIRVQILPEFPSLDGGQNEKVFVFTDVTIETLNDSMITLKFQCNTKIKLWLSMLEDWLFKHR